MPYILNGVAVPDWSDLNAEEARIDALDGKGTTPPGSQPAPAPAPTPATSPSPSYPPLPDDGAPPPKFVPVPDPGTPAPVPAPTPTPTTPGTTPGGSPAPSPSPSPSTLTASRALTLSWAVQTPADPDPAWVDPPDFPAGSRAYVGLDANGNATGTAGDDDIYAEDSDRVQVLRGGKGNDDYHLGGNVSHVTVIENVNEGIDRVQTWATDYTLPANCEILLMLGQYSHTLRGNNSGQPARYIGGPMADTFIPGKGTAWMQGGDGRNTFVFDAADGASRSRIVDFKPGADLVQLTNLGVTSWWNHVRAHLFDYGTYCTLRLGAGKPNIQFLGVSVSQLTPQDFGLPDDTPASYTQTAYQGGGALPNSNPAPTDAGPVSVSWGGPPAGYTMSGVVRLTFKGQNMASLAVTDASGKLIGQAVVSATDPNATLGAVAPNLINLPNQLDQWQYSNNDTVDANVAQDPFTKAASVDRLNFTGTRDGRLYYLALTGGQTYTMTGQIRTEQANGQKFNFSQWDGVPGGDPSHDLDGPEFVADGTWRNFSWTFQALPDHGGGISILNSRSLQAGSILVANVKCEPGPRFTGWPGQPTAVDGAGTVATLDIDTTKLPDGPLTLGAKAYSAPAGQAAQYSADAGQRQFTVRNTAASPVPAPAPTPAPSGSGNQKTGYTLLKDWNFGDNITTDAQLRTEFHGRFIYGTPPDQNGVDTLSANGEWQNYRGLETTDTAPSPNHVFKTVTDQTGASIKVLALRAVLPASVNTDAKLTGLEQGVNGTYAISTGAKSFTFLPNMAFAPGDGFYLSAPNGTGGVNGTVTSYDAATGATVLNCTGTWGQTGSTQSGQWWLHVYKITSGMLRSRATFKYGYFEMRARGPAGIAMWPAFWLNPEDKVWPPEIDIVELVYNAIGRDDHTASHHGCQGGNTSVTGGFNITQSKLNSSGQYKPGGSFDWSAQFHTYAVDWQGQIVSFYVDNILVCQGNYQWKHDDDSDGGPAHVLANLAVGGGWPGAPQHVADFPADFEIDYIRVYSKNAAAPSPSANIQPVPDAVKTRNLTLLDSYEFGTGKTDLGDPARIHPMPDYAAMRTFCQTRYPYGNWTTDKLNDEWQRYRDNNNHVFFGDRMELTARVVGGLYDGGIESGMIAVLKVPPKKAYIEYRVRVPPSLLGLWPACWEVAGNLADWPPEIDTLEMVINSSQPDVPDNSWNTFHGMKEGGSVVVQNISSLLDQWGSYHPHVDLSQAFHIFATEWVQDSRGDRFRTWVDNVLVADRIYPWTTSTGGDAGGRYIFVDLAVGGNWAGRNGVPAGSFPAGFAIDYIRVFA